MSILYRDSLLTECVEKCENEKNNTQILQLQKSVLGVSLYRNTA